MDVDTFNKYYDEQKAKSAKKNETAKAEEKKPKEEEPKPKEEELILEGEEEPKEKKEEPKKESKDAWPELDDLKNAGVAFDSHIQMALANLGQGELKQSGIFYPAAIKAMEADGNFAGLEAYKSIVAKDKVPVEDFEKATKAVQDAKVAAVTMLKTTTGLKDFYEDKNFKTVYIRVFAKFEGVPSLEGLEAKLKEHPNDKFTPFIKNAIKYTKEISPTDHKKFNELFKNVLVTAKEWAAKGIELDNALLKTE